METGEIVDIISIHAPAKGATTGNSFNGDNSAISIHAPAKGATTVNDLYVRETPFQSTLPRRERQIQ